jgi:hypothetical protein
MGRRAEALQATQEAVDLYRRLAAQHPDAFLPDLAGSLTNLGNALSEMGRRAEALQATQEAVDLYRRLAAQHPDAFLPDLAMSLNNLGNRLSEMGRRAEALQATQEAVEIRRRLAAQHPDAFLPDLARSLTNLSNVLFALDRWEEALQAAQEAVEIRRRLARQYPEAFLPDLAESLGAYGKALLGLGRAPEAGRLSRRACGSSCLLFRRSRPPSASGLKSCCRAIFAPARRRGRRPMRRWWRRRAGRSSREELFPFGVGRAGDESAGGGGPVGGRRVAWGVSNEFDRGACGWRSACAPNEFGLQGPSANGRPAPTGRCLLRRRRPTPGAQRLGRPISIGVKAFGRRSACAPNEFGLQGPSANGRPAPTGKVPFASAKADARRESASEGRFQSA